jgi:hypothetical protein
MIEDPLDHDQWVFDAGKHLVSAAALLAGFDIVLEYAFEALRPGHDSMTLSGCPGLVILPATPGRCHLLP